MITGESARAVTNFGRCAYGAYPTPTTWRRGSLEDHTMRRPARFIGLLAMLGLLLATAAPVGASAIDDFARVIRSRHAGATFVQVEGCRQIEVFVSAMDATFGSRSGPVNKQGLVGVFYRESDACAEPGPRGYPVTFIADAQSLDRLVTAPQFGTASISAVLEGTDGDGNPVQVGLDIEWVAAEAFERSRVSGNGWFPEDAKQGARVHTFSHGLRAAAVASGSVTVGGTRTELAPTWDASLEQIRYACHVIQHPQGGFDVDC
jgi:hypothetical protein